MSAVPTTFVARRAGQRLVRIPQRRVWHDNGEPETTPGVTYEFSKGRLATADADMIEWLRAHPLFGNREEGFWELDKTAVAPDPSDTIREVTEALVAGDLDVVREVLEVERAGWERPAVLAACEGALGISGEVADVERVEA